MRGFVKELPKLQAEHQSLQIRKYYSLSFIYLFTVILLDTNVALKISQISKEPTFRSRLEAEHSTPTFFLIIKI